MFVLYCVAVSGDVCNSKTREMQKCFDGFEGGKKEAAHDLNVAAVVACLCVHVVLTCLGLWV